MSQSDIGSILKIRFWKLASFAYGSSSKHIFEYIYIWAFQRKRQNNVKLNKLKKLRIIIYDEYVATDIQYGNSITVLICKYYFCSM